MSEQNNEREAFEAWLPECWPKDRFVDQEGDELYAEEWVQGAWIGWQARATGDVSAMVASQSAEPVATKCTRCVYIGRCDCEISPAATGAQGLTERFERIKRLALDAGGEGALPVPKSLRKIVRECLDGVSSLAQAAPSTSAQQAESMGVMDVVRLHNEIQRDLSAPAPSASPGALTDEREAFEAAWRAVYPQHGAGAFKHSEMSWGGYANTRVNDGWKMWQARAILAASPAPAQGAQEDARDAARDLTNFAFHNQVDINAAMSREQSQGGRDD